MLSTRLTVAGLTVLGLVSVQAYDLNIRFNKVTFGTTLDKNDYPLTPELADQLRQTADASSVTIEGDDSCLQCENLSEILATVSPPVHPSGDSNSPFWDDFRDVIERQMDRKSGRAPDAFMPLPNIWRHFDIAEVAEAVHDEFPGVWHAALLGDFLGAGVDFDSKTLPSLSNVQFIHGAVALSALNGWAFANVGPTNFASKWYNGRARPEEVAYLIRTGALDSGDGVPQDIIDDIMSMNLDAAAETGGRDFTAYPEGSPVHPSWPAMHSASSVGSLWIPTVLDLTADQLCEVRKLDYAIAYARTVAGVHFPTDNIAGLNLGQEVIARKLPAYLASQYGVLASDVEDKIATLRYDWNDFTTSDCYMNGLKGSVQRAMNAWCVENKAAGQSYARFNNQNYGWHWRCCSESGDRTNNRCMSDNGELIQCEDPAGTGNCHSVYGTGAEHLTGDLGAVALATIGSENVCDPTQWDGYDGKVCGACSALVNVRDYGGNCDNFCELQGLDCVNAWDDTKSNQCSTYEESPMLGCSYEFDDTSDGICQCDATSGRRRMADVEFPAELKAPLME